MLGQDGNPESVTRRHSLYAESHAISGPCLRVTWELVCVVCSHRQVPQATLGYPNTTLFTEFTVALVACASDLISDL
jgi:hypothetical protein